MASAKGAAASFIVSGVAPSLSATWFFDRLSCLPHKKKCILQGCALGHHTPLFSLIAAGVGRERSGLLVMHTNVIGLLGASWLPETVTPLPSHHVCPHHTLPRKCIYCSCPKNYASWKAIPPHISIHFILFRELLCIFLHFFYHQNCVSHYRRHH